MKNNIKAKIVETIAQYNTDWTKAIESAFEIYSQNWWNLNQEEFEVKIKWECNEKLQEIDHIDFMYDSDSERWASEEEMVEWYNNNVN